MVIKTTVIAKDHVTGEMFDWPVSIVDWEVNDYGVTIGSVYASGAEVTDMLTKEQIGEVEISIINAHEYQVDRMEALREDAAAAREEYFAIEEGRYGKQYEQEQRDTAMSLKQEKFHEDARMLAAEMRGYKK